MQVDRFPHLAVAFFRFKGCWVLPVERHMNFCFSEIPQSETRPPLAHRKGLPTKSQEYQSNVTCMPLNALPVGRKVVRESQHYGVQGAQEETEYPRRDRRRQWRRGSDDTKSSSGTGGAKRPSDGGTNPACGSQTERAASN